MQTTETQTTVGIFAEAKTIAHHHHDLAWLGIEEPAGWRQIGAGQHRVVYLNPAGDTVYKVGLDGANREEVRVLDSLRADGHEHAPEATLWEIAWTSLYGDRLRVTVVAMPYLPEDGSVPHAGMLLPGMGDFNPANIHAHRGKLWLIDAAGM